MELLSQMIHLWLETPRTLSRMQGPSTFREPYPVAQPPMAPATFVIPQTHDTKVHPGRRRVFVHIPANDLNCEQCPPALFTPFQHTQQRLTYAPAWPAAQLGPLPLMPPTQPAPVVPAVAPPMVPPQPSVTPLQLGQMPNYYPAPAQPYRSLSTGPVATLPAVLCRAPGHGNEDSETAKPDKFTGREPSKLHPFVVSCIMAFDS